MKIGKHIIAIFILLNNMKIKDINIIFLNKLKIKMFLCFSNL